MLEEQDTVNEKTKISQIYSQTSDVFWKIRSRVTSLQNVFALLVDYESYKLDKEIKDLLVSSRFEVWQLSRYADNFRDFSLLQANELEKQLDFENINVKDVIREAIYNLHTFKDNWGKKYFFFDKTPSLIKVRCDKNRLIRIIETLFINSIIYSGETVSVIISTKELAENRVSISIKDNGHGIREADMPSVFTNGFRSEYALKNRFQGLGMELHLAKEILAKTNGVITVESKENAGCTVTVSLPLAK
jgi:signal transduction histidine kinase